jgi:hypothetical protein
MSGEEKKSKEESISAVCRISFDMAFTRRL